MKVDKGLKEYLRGKDYAVLVVFDNGTSVNLDDKNKIILWSGSCIFNAIKYAKSKNLHPILIRLG